MLGISYAHVLLGGFIAFLLNAVALWGIVRWESVKLERWVYQLLILELDRLAASPVIMSSASPTMLPSSETLSKLN